jgi:Fic family protein
VYTGTEEQLGWREVMKRFDGGTTFGRSLNWHLPDSVLRKARFWEIHAHKPFNDRQRFMLNKLLDGFEGKLTSSKWAQLAKCSQDTALRDILDLIKHGALAKDPAGGRSTSYSLVEPGATRKTDRI